MYIYCEPRYLERVLFIFFLPAYVGALEVMPGSESILPATVVHLPQLSKDEEMLGKNGELDVDNFEKVSKVSLVRGCPLLVHVRGCPLPVHV